MTPSLSPIMLLLQDPQTRKWDYIILSCPRWNLGAFSEPCSLTLITPLLYGLTHLRVNNSFRLSETFQV